MHTKRLHNPGAGISPRRLDFNSMQYASELARYISCPSTVRVRTLDMWGRAPSIDRIRNMQEVHRRGREIYRELVGEPTVYEDMSDFRVRGINERRPAPIPPQPEEKPTPVTPEEAQAARAPVRLLGSELVQSVASDFGLTLQDLRGQGRSAVLVDARAVVAMILHKRGMSYPQIGRWLGGRDHSTTINLVSKFDIYERRNPKVRASYQRHRAMDAMPTRRFA